LRVYLQYIRSSDNYQTRTSFVPIDDFNLMVSISEEYYIWGSDAIQSGRSLLADQSGRAV
jgi:hypothetical protein